MTLPTFTPAMISALLPELLLLALAGLVLLVDPFLRPRRSPAASPGPAPLNGTWRPPRAGVPDGRRPVGHSGPGADLRPPRGSPSRFRRDDALRRGGVRLCRRLPLRRRRH